MTITSNNGNTTTTTNVHQTFNSIKSPSHPGGLMLLLCACFMHIPAPPKRSHTRQIWRMFQGRKRGQKGSLRMKKTINNLMGEKKRIEPDNINSSLDLKIYSIFSFMCTNNVCVTVGHQSERCNRNPKPEFSRSSGGGSTSASSTCSIAFEISSTENGMLQK